MGPIMASFLYFIITVLLVRPLYSHVALTYPPARKYDLDFLDNSRTKAPCGMPKGDIRTSLLSGSKINVSWHLGYPHKGGFQLQLLDELERPVLDLTPTIKGSQFVSNDATAQFFEVQLPLNYTCNNCTLRLIRQALEWGNNYKFWSCADVDIKERKQFRETCSGHGRYLVGRCKCDRLYYGLHCQYREECLEDSDCGDHGKCINVEATTAPRQQCYCQLGWYGPGCIKRSPMKTTEIDFGLYKQKRLSDTFMLYWRHLKEHKEIEIVMVVNGTSYAGIGWRPLSLDKSCKNFPQIGPLAQAADDNTSAKAEPKSEPEPSSEPTAEPSATPEPKSEAEPSSEPEPTSVELNTKKSVYNRRSAGSASRPVDIPDGTVETSVSFQVSRSQGRKKRETDDESVAETTIGDEASTEPTSEPLSLPAKQTKSLPQKNAQPITVPKSEPEPVAEPKSEPEPTAEPKSEPEPTAEPKSQSEPNLKAIPNSKPEPIAEPKSEPEPTSAPEPEPKSEPNKSESGTILESVSTKTRNAKLQTTSVENEGKLSEPLNPYTPRHDFNPMDCTDIIIGSARNTSSRIADYYTRDRSTPKMDSFWGGKNDITAAMGFEKDGVTTILFRKKLLSKEPSDHTIIDDLMHVIWAQGQEPGKYVHVPASGVETSAAKVKDFYKPDELKYHGHGLQRGFTTINFLEEEKKIVITQDSSGETVQSVEDKEMPRYCGGEWKHPRTCSTVNFTCDYWAKWEYKPKKDEIHFTITTKHTNLWTGIAFSKDEKMSQTDAILGWVDKTGRHFLMDTWISGYTQPLLDSSQDIYNKSGRIVDGTTVLSFTRKRISNDKYHDLSFTDDECLFMMFPTKGGIFNSVNKKIRKHEIVPMTSIEKICIKSCGFSDDVIDALTTPEPPKIGYNVQVKIVELGDNFQIPKPDSLEYEDLSNTIRDNFKPVFENIPGYRRITVEDLKEDRHNMIAVLNLELDKAVVEKGRALNDEDDNREQVEKAVKDSIVTGRVGALKVDPSYLYLDSQIETSNVITDSSESSSENFFRLSETKLYVVIGCLAALILVAIVQAGCTIYKAAAKSSSSHKDHLIPNSAWKDYSAANTNYAFETYEPDEKKQQMNGKGRSETLPSKNRPQRPTSRPPSVPLQPASYMGDTRSLQRPRGHYAPNSLERSTFSLPRTAYERHRPQQDMQPDFYFMPSQRKYSGEVVRVYVDYNNQPK